SEAKAAGVSLPQVCSGKMHLKDTASGAAVDVALSGATAVAGQSVGGIVVYPAALGGSAAVLHRHVPSGSEDFIFFPTRPATPEVDYTISFGSGVSGLRLVGNE